jgi:hypothetical protein
MIIKEYGMEDLAKARKLQKDLCDLHIPTPVMSWGYEIKDTNEIIEKGIGKSNSYTRNALNILAYNIGMCMGSSLDASSFGDGYLNIKNQAGIISITGLYRYHSASYEAKVRVGSNTNAESLDSYLFPTTTLTAGTQTTNSIFNPTTRIYTTTLSTPFFNGTGASVDVAEAGMYLTLQTGSTDALMVRDVFTPITVNSGYTITWTYTTEVAFPNP